MASQGISTRVQETCRRKPKPNKRKKWRPWVVSRADLLHKKNSISCGCDEGVFSDHWPPLANRWPSINCSIHPFIHPSIHSPIRSFIHSPIYPPIHLSVHSFINLSIHSLTHPLIHSFVHPSTRMRTMDDISRAINWWCQSVLATACLVVYPCADSWQQLGRVDQVDAFQACISIASRKLS